ncbi:hypothetical protein FFA01_25440 [Frigoribacterium faeni]|uniref:Uncharacterized protein n=1 Tax=Frigoribacterium faeni TaxID=145483 RepID=A0ABQ0UTE9_9MICO|nr:hypothetical protein FFA01_25440 [Frigoribacterium faeni]
MVEVAEVAGAGVRVAGAVAVAVRVAGVVAGVLGTGAAEALVTVEARVDGVEARVSVDVRVAGVMAGPVAADAAAVLREGPPAARSRASASRRVRGGPSCRGSLTRPRWWCRRS